MSFLEIMSCGCVKVWCVLLAKVGYRGVVEHQRLIDD